MIRKTIYLCMLTMLSVGVWAQNDSIQKNDSTFTLQEAIDYGLQHSHEVQKAQLEIIKAKKKVWETTAIGLPQVNAEFAYSYMLTVPDALEQFSSLGDMFAPIYTEIGINRGYLQGLAAIQNQNLPDTLQLHPPDMEAPEGESEATTTDDLRKTITLDFTVTQLIFNGSYIVGLQASKTYQRLSKFLLQQQEVNVEKSIADAYVGVVVAKENLKILSDILSSTNKSIAEMEAMYKEGFVENTDVDQLKLTAATIETNLKNIELQVGMAKDMLKLTMGMDIEHPINLSQGLDEIMAEKSVIGSKDFDFDVTQNISYQLLDTQEKLAELDLKNKKAEFLPTVAGFYQHEENFNDKAFNLTPPDIVGVSVSIPIFSSWGRVASMQQKQITLEQTRHDKANAVSGLRIQYRNALNTFLTAKNTYENNKTNLELSKRIYEKTHMKYKEGVSTSFDLSQANGQYLKSNTDYFMSAMQLIYAKTELDKLLKQFKPIND